MTRRMLRAPIAAVTFDLDFTLWDLDGVLPHAEAVCQGLLEQHYPAVTQHFDVAGMRELRNRIAAERPELAHDVTALRRAGLRRAGEQAGYAGDALEALVEEAFEVFLEARHAVRLYPDTLPMLRALQGRVAVGAITNGNAEIARIGLDGYFDFALSAVELGAAKPSHLVFDTAAGRAGVPAGQIVHVGDDVHSDVYGAAENGMQAVWLNRDNAVWPEDVPRVSHTPVSTLAELEGMLLGLIRESI
ncbi:HAD-IA family hydrolase [Spiribacter vilamensis]|uniref:Putative hydrolase of the HAD superfamily n=1 Tax=Spiribacter vilamensis TaxID=531306 RepID=A0A4Q8CYG5_9GAMM|nr:HAD-IA family hydrolase [Spiribacter vilamensis]RZU98021.1 putative hydrolase of the HAD superfamily [Spiribacter vilamensis]TVO61074.1 HAD-IA family hydrolase [Spiribacter vilamensis]